MRSTTACEVGYISAEPTSKKPASRKLDDRTVRARGTRWISLRLISAARAVSKSLRVDDPI
jgi:hypothetical protein